MQEGAIHLHDVMMISRTRIGILVAFKVFKKEGFRVLNVAKRDAEVVGWCPTGGARLTGRGPADLPRNLREGNRREETIVVDVVRHRDLHVDEFDLLAEALPIFAGCLSIALVRK